MLTDCTTGPEAGRKCIHPSRIITLAETIRYRNGYGAGDEARTRYLHLGKVALYQMSYTRILVPPVGIEPTTRGFSVRCSTY